MANSFCDKIKSMQEILQHCFLFPQCRWCLESQLWDRASSDGRTCETITTQKGLRKESVGFHKVPTEPLMQTPQSQGSGFLPYLVCLMGEWFPFIISINLVISQQRKGMGENWEGAVQSVRLWHCIQGNFCASRKQNSSHSHYLSTWKTHTTKEQCKTLPFPFTDTHLLRTYLLRKDFHSVAISKLQI